MIGTALATLAMAFMAMMPGAVVGCKSRANTALLAALAAASLAISLMTTALVGIALHAIVGVGLPAWALGPTSLVLAGAALALTRANPSARLPFEWPALAPVVAAAMFAALIYSLGFTDLSDGGLRIHAWYNADWFKHLAHTHALADYGVPARDIFANGRPLHYYWLIYILPGAGASFGGDAWTAMYIANFVFVSLLFLVFYGLLRATGLVPLVAAATVVIATIAVAPTGTWIELWRDGARGVLTNSMFAPAEPPFTAFICIIPQHAFALALLLGWAAVTVDDSTHGAPRARWIVVAALATVLTISTLFGAVLLAIYGLTELRNRRLQAVPELVAVAVMAALLVLVLGVIKIDDAHSALQSPVLADAPSELSALERAIHSLSVVIGKNGLALVIAVIFAAKWKPEGERQRTARDLAILIIALALTVSFAVEFVFGTRLSWEFRLRIANLPTISIAIIGGYFVSRGWQSGGRARLAAIGVPLVLLILAVPSLILANAWVGQKTDPYATIIPRDDRQALETLRRLSAPRDVVWQYPEKPYLSDIPGRDSWSVVIAGRTNVATERATDYPAAYPDIQRAYRYFAGEDVPVPESVDWIYLSRALHPQSYDALLARLAAPGSGWHRRACYPDACVFERAPLR